MEELGRIDSKTGSTSTGICERVIELSQVCLKRERIAVPAQVETIHELVGRRLVSRVLELGQSNG